MKPISLSFLGTCAGGGPLPNRACSSSILDVGSAIWMIDCAEGTPLQFMQSRHRSNRLNKIFITHMHADHCLGVVTLLGQIITGVSGTEREDLRVQLYGPKGLRKLIRTTLEITQLSLNGKYAVHELLFPDEKPFSTEPQDLHVKEAVGRDIFPDNDGFWRDFEESDGMRIDAGPIKHRIRCLGYVFKEHEPTPSVDRDLVTEPIRRNIDALAAQGVTRPFDLIPQLLKTRVPITLPDGFELQPPPVPEPRKVVILGDTCDASAIQSLCVDASLLVHEATNAFIPGKPVYPTGSTPESVRQKAIDRGHSTPVMAGEFARSIRARRLVMNHFSSRFVVRFGGESASRIAERFPPANQLDRPSMHRASVWTKDYKTPAGFRLREIENQATAAWQEKTPGSEKHEIKTKWSTALAAWDTMRVEFLSHEVLSDWRAEVI